MCPQKCLFSQEHFYANEKINEIHSNKNNKWLLVLNIYRRRI